MTVNLAWRDGNDIFLVVDSALTYPFGGMPRHAISAVGETQRVGQHRVEESGAKVMALSRTSMAAYSGDSGAAIAALIAIRDDLARNVPLRDSLAALVQKFEQSRRFRLFVAGPGSARTELWIVDPGEPTTVLREVYLDRDPIVLGSLPAELVTQVRESLLGLYGLAPLAATPSRLLATMVITLQAMGQRINLFEVNVGGTFFGMMLHKGKVVFQDDLLYALFRRHHLRPSETPHEDVVLLFSGIRDGVLITLSSLTNEAYRLFLTDVHRTTDADIHKLMSRLVAESGAKMPVATAHYGFIDRDTGACAQVYCPSRKPQRFFGFPNDRLTLLPPLVRTLSSFPTPQDGVLPGAVPHVILSEE